jgi:hypothetical protein
LSALPGLEFSEAGEENGRCAAKRGSAIRKREEFIDGGIERAQSGGDRGVGALAAGFDGVDGSALHASGASLVNRLVGGF